MAAVLTVSNYLVQFPVGDWMTWAAFTYPLAFLVTDCVNRAADAATARRVVLLLVLFSVCRCLFSLIIISPPAMSPPPILSLSPPALHLLPAPLLPLRNFWM